ncbi:MAG TPA: hypothetical protein PK787_03725, partial [Burkholderiaceae bacterium]|nr:hypothetical protein [Burkholderiaceae bacterium]
MLAAPAPPRNSLRELRSLRSDNRGESEVRSALRARAGTAALLGCARARRQPAARTAARTFADSVVALSSTGLTTVASTPDVPFAAGGSVLALWEAQRRRA